MNFTLSCSQAPARASASAPRRALGAAIARNVVVKVRLVFCFCLL